MFNIFDRNETYPRKTLRTSVSANIMVQNCAKIHQNLFEIVTVINTCYSLSVRAKPKILVLLSWVPDWIHCNCIVQYYNRLPTWPFVSLDLLSWLCIHFLASFSPKCPSSFPYSCNTPARRGVFISWCSYCWQRTSERYCWWRWDAQLHFQIIRFHLLK